VRARAKVLLHHRNPEVRRIAAERLANYGDRGFGNALPTLLERLRGQPDADSRLHAARTIRAFSHYGRNILRSQVPELLECHRAEASQSVRWAIVELLRAIDLKAVNGLPVTRDLVFLEDPSGRTVADGWQTEPDTERSGVVWKLVVDSTRPSRSDYVLAQIAGTSDTSIHACLTEPSIHAKTTPLNVEISVSIKAIAGSQQQGGGIAWRHLGPDNYYAVGLNALDGSVRLFKVVDGQCVELASRGGLDVSPGKWHRLTVQHVRAKIWCSLDEAKCLEITDVPITNQGSFGLWTRADAKTHFDGVRVADFASGIVPESP